MTGTGLVGVPDPSEVFGHTHGGEVGAAVTCALEGTRPLLLEIQSLVAPTDLAMPRRVGAGVDPKRLAMIVAVLSRHAGLPLGGADVFVNVAGGVRIDEPGADLGIALAIASAAKGVPVEEGVAAYGEIGAHRPAPRGDPERPAGRGMPQVRHFHRDRAGDGDAPAGPRGRAGRFRRLAGIFPKMAYLQGFWYPVVPRRWSLFEAAGTFCDYGRKPEERLVQGW